MKEMFKEFWEYAKKDPKELAKEVVVLTVAFIVFVFTLWLGL